MLKRFFVICCFLIIGLLALVPYLLSTEKGKAIVKKSLMAKFPKIAFDDIRFSWFGPQTVDGIKFSNKNMDLYIEKISVDINFFELLYIQDEKKLFSIQSKGLIQNGNIVLKYKNLPKSNLTNINGSVEIVDGVTKAKLKGKSVLEKTNGSFDIELIQKNKKLNGEIFLKNFPTIVIDKILQYKKQNFPHLSKILGNKLDLSSKIDFYNFMGPLFLDINSKNLKTTIFAKYKKNSITLEKPLKGYIYLTKELSNHVLKDINPILLNIYSKNPIYINIDHKGFLLPIPLDLKKLEVSKATIAFPRLKAKNQGNLHLFISILKHQFASNIIDIWLTPITIGIKDGLITTSRVDMLLDSKIHLLTFGNIDILKNRVNMTLGLPSNTLRYSFYIDDLPNNYVLTIPIKGTTNKIKIDTAMLAAKIAALKATELDNPMSYILKMFRKIQEDQSKIPAAKRPFPWE